MGLFKRLITDIKKYTKQEKCFRKIKNSYNISYKCKGLYDVIEETHGYCPNNVYLVDKCRDCPHLVQEIPEV